MMNSDTWRLMKQVIQQDMTEFDYSRKEEGKQNCFTSDNDKLTDLSRD